MQASISKIESLGLSDGPGIRTVIFFNGCSLRCKFCHNPETWKIQENNITLEELVEKILRFKNYYGSDGGVTLSGGEPLLHRDFIIELCKKLKEHDIHIALDTAGVGIGKYREILENIDLVLLDVKEIDSNKYKELVGTEINEFYKFIEVLNSSNKEVYIRQVIIPDYNDNKEYIDRLIKFLTKINNIKKVELLPFHNMASSKYEDLKIKNPYLGKPNMDKKKCIELEEYINREIKSRL